jgi:oligopeptide transport system substrate-binding protein
MVKNRRCIALITLILFVILISSNSMSLKVFANEKVEVGFVGVDHSPLVVGDTETFYLTSKNAENVQYKVFISDKDKESWIEITQGYSELTQATVPYAVKYPGIFKKGKYKLLVQVREEGSIKDYDNTYIFYLSCVDRDDNNRVYANDKLELIGETFSSEEDTYVVGKKINLKGIKNISGMKGPYTYKLHIFDAKEGLWKLDSKEYREDIEWTPTKPGVYVLDLWAMSGNSTLWPKLKKDPKAKLYEAWKMKVITVKDIDLEQYLTVPLNEKFNSLDSSNVDSSQVILTEVMEGLTRLESYGDKSMAKAAGAESWKVSKDGTTWSFNLRNFYWSDGEKVTARDYEYAWKRTLNNSTNASLLYPIKGAEKYSLGQASAEELGIKVIDDKTIEVKLEYPIPNFEQLVSTTAYLPQRQDIVKKYGEQYGQVAFNFVSNGPFILSTWDKEHNVVLKKSPKYWDSNSVKLETLTLNLNGGDDSNLLEFREKQLDTIMGGTELTKTLGEKGEKNSYLETIQSPSLIDYMVFNKNPKNNGLTSNNKIRLALSLAINREVYCSNFVEYSSLPAYGFIPNDIQNGNTIYRNIALQPLMAYKNLDVKKLFNEGLGELNLSDNKLRELTFLVISDTETMKKSSEIIKGQWETSLGVKVNIVYCSFSDFFNGLYEGNFDVAQLLGKAQYNDPLALLDMFTLDGGATYNWISTDYDVLIQKIKHELDMSKRMLLIKEAESLLLEKAIVAPLSYRNNKMYINDYLKGVMNTRNSVMEFKYAYTAGR